MTIRRNTPLRDTAMIAHDALLERVLTARPDADIHQVRQMAPVFRNISDAMLVHDMGRMRQRIAWKRSRGRSGPTS